MTKMLIGIAFIIGLVVLWSGSGAIYGKFQAYRLAHQRGRANYQAFANYFKEECIPNEVSQAVYQHLQQWMRPSKSEFPVMPTDNIIKIYGIVEEDLIDFIGDILESLEREFPTKDNPIYGTDVLTVADMVRFVSGCEKGSNRIARLPSAIA